MAAALAVAMSAYQALGREREAERLRKRLYSADPSLAAGLACAALVHGGTLHHFLPYLAERRTSSITGSRPASTRVTAGSAAARTRPADPGVVVDGSRRPRRLHPRRRFCATVSCPRHSICTR